MKRLMTAIIAFGALTLSAQPVQAQTTYWSQCPDNSSIVRCETYNCPKGDTNRDGVCDLKDDTATISESRNDSFCANPPSGCGQVMYHATNQSAACAVRVKQNNNNCDLYKAGTLNFSGATSSPTATSIPTATPQSRLNTSPIPSSSPKPATTLPKTGPELWVSIFIAGIGMYGLYLYEKPRKRED